MEATRPDPAWCSPVKRRRSTTVAAALGECGRRASTREQRSRRRVYRPYQMLYAGELDFVMSTGRRGLVGQLDMIGFSNPFVPPVAEQLFFFARNLQRHMMRPLDGVTFISQFGRTVAIAECPELDPRPYAMSCRAAPTRCPVPGTLGPTSPLPSSTPFVACLSSTFWHKNRVHADRDVRRAGVRHGYAGHLVIGGPEPYYGRSTDAETRVARHAADIASGYIGGAVPEAEKWWLLASADASSTRRSSRASASCRSRPPRPAPRAWRTPAPPG